MIAGVCFKDAKIEQVFRRDTAFCQKCGEKLVKFSVIRNAEGEVELARVQDDEWI